MSAFNEKKPEPEVIRNFHGERVYATSKKTDLIGLASCSLVSDKFYESKADQLKRALSLVEEVAKVDPEFVAKLAVYSRNELGLRSFPALLIAALSKYHKGDDLVSRAARNFVFRVDDVMEVLGAYALVNDVKSTQLNKISVQLKKGLGDSLNKFNEYSLGKYKRDTREITLKDAVCLLHPKPITSENSELFKKILNDTLAVPETWETEISAKGNKAEVWESLVANGKLPALATLRNINNLLKADVSTACLKNALDALENRITGSKIFPFQVYIAWKTVASKTGTKSFNRFGYGAYSEDQIVADPTKVGFVLRRLEKVFEKLHTKEYFENLTGYPSSEFDNTLVAIDSSGSMGNTINEKSIVTSCEVGGALAAIIAFATEFSHTVQFDADCRVLKPSSSAMGLIKNATDTPGGTTYGHKVMEHAIRSGKSYKRIMFFTDMILYHVGSFYGMRSTNELRKTILEYRKKVNKDVKIFFFDVAGYANSSPIAKNDENIWTIHGWTEKIFSLIKILEEGGSIEKTISSKVMLK
jgi:hypothetical protein